jgi:peptide/nickel transport system permease protein
MSLGAEELLLDADIALESVELVPGEIAARSPAQLFWRRFKHDRVAMVSAGFIIVLIVVAIAAPVIRSIFGLPDPNLNNPGALDIFGSPSGPSGAHPLASTSPAATFSAASSTARASRLRSGSSAPARPP